MLLLLALISTPLLLVAFREDEKPVQGEQPARQNPPEPRVEEPPPSEIASPGFYPARYDIEARYLEDPRRISGTQNVRYVNAEGEPVDSLHFNLWTNDRDFEKRGGGTSVSDVEVEGQKAEFSVDGTRLKVELPSRLKDGDMADVTLDFETTIPDIAAPFGHSSGISMLGVWHPVLVVRDEEGWNHNPPTDFGEPYFAEAADYKVELTLPRHLTPVATGIEKGRFVSGAGKRITYEARSVRDFALAVGKDLSRESRRVGDTRVNVYYSPASEFRAHKAMNLASKSLQRFSGLYGPYPYRELDLVDTPLIAGTEYSTLAFVSMVNTKDELFETVIPHEVAHQWWYVQVGSNEFEEPWLDEALATYSEWLFAGDAGTRFPQAVRPAVPLDSPVSTFPDKVIYQKITYRYGAQVYRELSQKIGKQTMMRGLRTYLKRYRYQIATSEDLIETLSETAGRDLRPFFESRGVTTPKKKNPVG